MSDPSRTETTNPREPACARVEAELAALVCGEAVAPEVLAHVAACPRCAELVRTARLIPDLLRAVSDEHRCLLPEDFEELARWSDLEPSGPTAFTAALEAADPPPEPERLAELDRRTAVALASLRPSGTPSSDSSLRSPVPPPRDRTATRVLRRRFAAGLLAAAGLVAFLGLYRLAFRTSPQQENVRFVVRDVSRPIDTFLDPLAGGLFGAGLLDGGRREEGR